MGAMGDSFGGPRNQSAKGGRRAALIAGLPVDAADAIAMGAMDDFNANTAAMQAQSRDFNAMNNGLGGIMELFMAVQGNKRNAQATQLQPGAATPPPGAAQTPQPPANYAVGNQMRSAPEVGPTPGQPGSAMNPGELNRFPWQAQQLMGLLQDEQLFAMYRALRQPQPTAGPLAGGPNGRDR